MRNQHSFAQVPTVDIPRSTFDRSHNHKTTFDAGYLVPFYVDEALPGDTFRASTTLFARLSSPLKDPIMDNLYLDTFFFAVPRRLLWDNFRRFMGERDPDPDSSIDYLEPLITLPSNSFDVGSVGDYFGLPTDVTSAEALSVSAMPFRAYNLIYEQWFKDQNLIDGCSRITGDGPDSLSDYPLQRRGKRHDYFTSCLPWPQKGDAVTLPIGSSATVWGDGKALGIASEYSVYGLYANTGGGVLGAETDAHNTNKGTTVSGTGSWPTVNKSLGVIEKGDGTSGLYADLSEATASTINEIREAFQVQRMLERDARGGTRYNEIIASHFQVHHPDLSWRPEFLGSSSFRININPVQQTSGTGITGSTPQGKLTAYAVGNGRAGFTKSFTEHCIVMGIVCVRSDYHYQGGIPKMFLRRTRLDHYWPSLAHLGEQVVTNKEILYTGAAATDDDPFGYQERYAEYRYCPSKITGEFRSSYATPLDSWHLAQDFGGTTPVLGQDFIEENPPMSRVLAVTTQHHIIFDSHMELHCARPMPVFSVPGLIDHF